MIRDVSHIVIVMAFVLGGPLCVVAGALVRPAPELSRSGRAAELAAWRRLWLPLVPAGLALMFLVGWALQEQSDPDEMLHPAVAIAAAPWALQLLRVMYRAARALRGRSTSLATTVGLLRPRIEIDPRLARELDPEALDAVFSHEAAHARHRDPLRIWLAQIAADLQWPAPSAEIRFRQWSHALELARDEEARQGGARGDALAAAIVTAAQLGRGQRRLANATLIGQPELLRDRIGRLLRPVRSCRVGRRMALGVAALAFAAAAGLGALDGDFVVRCLPGISW